MAKELPFFKFEPSEWLEGEIQVCSDIAVVCFINLCSGYWLKLGCISYAFALQKYCNRNKDALQELINNKIITIIDDKICINFLDKQLNEFKNVSEKRTEAANKRWGNKGKDAIALQLECKSNAIREDKIREDNIINNEFFQELLISESWIEINAKNNRITPEKVKKYLKTFFDKLTAEGDRKNNKKEFMSHFARWLPIELKKEIKDKPKITPLI
jgi:hypothetical protein